MKTLSTLIGVGIIAVTVTIIGGTSVMAQTAEPEENPTPVTTQQQTREERTETRSAERCERITEKLTTRIGRVNEATERQTGLYERLVGRLDNVIESAAAVEYDTAALIAARDAVNTQIEAFVAISTDYTSDLAASADVACTQTPETYGAAISSARDSLREVRAAALLIRTTFRDQAIPALQDLRAFLATLSGDTDDASSAARSDEEGAN